MRYTVLLTPECDPLGYVAHVPVLGVVTQAGSVETALEAAYEAAYLDITGCLDDGEAVPVEPEGAMVGAITVEALGTTGRP